MKTVIWKEIDGFKIIQGFDKELIDSVKTREIVKKELAGLLEYQEMNNASAKYIKALGSSKKESSSKQKDALKNLLDDLKDKRKRLFKKIDELNKSLVKHFPLKHNEEVLSESEFNEFKELHKKAIKNGELLDLNKNKVLALKGSVYYLRNGDEVKAYSITKIGEDFPADALLSLNSVDKELFEKGKKIERLAAMSVSEKLDEFESEKKKMVKDVVFKITELELTGSSESEAKAIAFDEYGLKLTGLKSEYGQ